MEVQENVAYIVLIIGCSRSNKHEDQLDISIHL